MTDQSSSAYLAVIARRKWWVIAVTALLVLAVLGVSLVQTKEYSATAQVLASSSANLNSPGATVPLTAGQLATYVELVQSPQVARLANNQPGMSKAKASVSATLVGTTNIIAITATSVHPADAAVVANAYAYGLTTYEQDLATTQAKALFSSYQRSLTELGPKISAAEASKSPTSSQLPMLLAQQTLLEQDLASAEAALAQAATGVSVASRAVVPTSPSSPKPVRNTILALLVGLLLGIGVAFALDHLDETVTSRDDLDHFVENVPVLGMIPWVRSWKRRGVPVLISRSEPTAPAAESYWALRTAMMFTLQDRPARTIVVTSAGQSEGKTSVTANLGVVFACGGHRTVVVSCDLRRPRLGRFFDLTPAHGLTSVLLGDMTLQDAVQPVPGVKNLWMLDAGPVPTDPHQLLSSPRTSDIFNELAKHFDYVLIDSPPLLPVADALALGQVTQATMLVIAAGQTRKRELVRAIEMLETVNAPLLGLVLNEVTSTSGYGYSYYDSYSYKYEAKPGKHRKQTRLSKPRTSVLPMQEHEAANSVWPGRFDDETTPNSGSTDDAEEMHDRHQTGSLAPD